MLRCLSASSPVSLCWFLLLLLLAVPTVGGCSKGKKGCLNPQLMSTEVEKSGLVTMFFRLECDGKSIEGLGDDDFQVFENGEPISAFESQKRVAASEQGDGSVFLAYTMLLIDMSGSIIDSGNVEPLVSAAKTFVRKLSGPGQKIGIYAFDGRAYIEEIVPFSIDEDELLAGLDLLTTYKVTDRSTNLNGAVINGIERLRGALQYEQVALLSAGTLVVFTDGTDRAQRFVSLEAQEVVDKAVKRGLSVYTIGLGVEVNEDELKLLGGSGFEYVTNASAILDAFDRIAEKIEQLNSGYYGLAYCSSARGGTQEITVRITYKNEESVIKTSYTADLFGLGCSTENAVDPGTSGTSGGSDATSGSSDALSVDGTSGTSSISDATSGADGTSGGADSSSGTDN